jgi:hypothetical protein
LAARFFLSGNVVCKWHANAHTQKTGRCAHYLLEKWANISPFGLADHPAAQATQAPIGGWGLVLGDW